MPDTDTVVLLFALGLALLALLRHSCRCLRLDPTIAAYPVRSRPLMQADSLRGSAPWRTTAGYVRLRREHVEGNAQRRDGWVLPTKGNAPVKLRYRTADFTALLEIDDAHIIGVIEYLNRFFKCAP